MIFIPISNLKCISMAKITDFDAFVEKLKGEELKECKKLSLFQTYFNDMAKYILGNLAIKVDETIYYPLEIEFYYCNEKVENVESFKCTYKRKCEAGEFLLHYSGLDICFATIDNSFGGILIRSILKHQNGVEDIVISGPLKCANEILNQCFKSKKKALPEIIGDSNRNKGDIYATLRQGIETGVKFESLRTKFNNHEITDEELPRFAYYIEGVKWQNNYSANPSINYKREKPETRGKYSKQI